MPSRGGFANVAAMGSTPAVSTERATAERPRRRLAACAAVAGAAFAFATPALWNGYPLVFYDTLDYFWISLTGDFLSNRTMPYGAFLAATHVRTSFWLTVAAQCLIAAYVVRECLDAIVPGRADAALVPLAATLTLLTGLPWYTVQIMPDAFAGVVALGTAALVLGGARLGAGRRAILAAIVVVAASVHPSHLLLLVGLALALPALSWLAGRRFPIPPRDRILPAAAAALAALLILAIHWGVGGKAVLSPSASVYLFARFLQDGLAQRYLEETCPGGSAPQARTAAPPELRICRERHRLPPPAADAANQFLWNHDWGGASPFMDLGGWKGFAPEAEAVVVGSLRAYPLAHLGAALGHFLRQLTMVRTGDGLEPIPWILQDDIGRTFPIEIGAFLGSRQQRDPAIDFGALNAVHVPVLLAATVALVPLAVWGWRRRDRLLFGAAAIPLLALLGNAFICGALSNPNHRYQSRIAWIAVFALVAWTLRWFEAGRAERAHSQRRTERL